MTEVPDQHEDPEGYIAHVQAVQEKEADLKKQEEEIARERGQIPPAVDEEAEAALAAEVAAREAEEAPAE